MQAVNDDPHAKSPVQLTLEEINVLKDCRVNSVYYRGIPIGTISAIVARGVVVSGKFPLLSKWSGLFYTGMFGIGFMGGVASYRGECVRKLMALENSVLAESYRDFLEKKGIPSPYPKKVSEFDSPPPISETSGSNRTRQNDEFASPLMRRMEQQREQEKPTRRWDEIRQQSRQPYVEPSKGITFDQLRKQNRASQSAPVEIQTDNPPQRALDIESFQSQQFEDTSRPSVLNFSRDDDAKSMSYSSDDDTQVKVSSNAALYKRPRSVVRTNKYGDDME